MLTLEGYRQAAQTRNAAIQIDGKSEQLMTRPLRGGLLGRVASWLREHSSSSRATDRATWKNFIETIRSHYKDDAAIAPLIHELEEQSASQKPLTARQVNTSLKNAEQLVLFKNEQTLFNVLNEKAESHADQPAGLANTSHEFLRAAMDEVYQDVASKIDNPDSDSYTQKSSRLAKEVVGRVKQLKPEAGEQRLSPDQVRQAVKEAAKDIVGRDVVVQNRGNAINRYSVDPNLGEHAPGNRLFLEAAAAHGLKIDPARLSPIVLDDLTEEVARKACGKAYQELLASKGGQGQVTEAGIEAAVKARLNHVFETRYLPTIEQIKQLDIDASAKDKLIDYVCHGSMKKAGHFDWVKKVADGRQSLAGFYKKFPQLVHELEKGEHDAAKTQELKTDLYTELLKHGKALGAQWSEIISSRWEADGKVDLEMDNADDREAFYTMVGQLSPSLSLADEEIAQLKESCAMPSAQKALGELKLAHDVVSGFFHDLYSSDMDLKDGQDAQEVKARSALDVSKSLSSVAVSLEHGLVVAPQEEHGSSPAQASDMSFSSLDDAVIAALHESGMELPSPERSE